MENETLNLLVPPPEECLGAWLAEIYARPVRIQRRQLLRHRDFSFVERLFINDGQPQTLIYKVVLPPWDIEKALHEKVLVPELSHSPRLYLSASYGEQAVLFIQDFGENALLDCLKKTDGLELIAGKEIARLHRDYERRIAQISLEGVLQIVLPADFAGLACDLAQALDGWKMISRPETKILNDLGKCLSLKLADEPVSLVHGDLYAENLLFAREHLCIIDWSWFARISTAIVDLATLTMDHFKNGELFARRDEIIQSYCLEYGRNLAETYNNLPYAEMLNRLLFLEWLVERRRRGIMGTTVGPVETLISSLIGGLGKRLSELQGQKK